MPLEQFYGGSGVEILYPNHMMNSHLQPFSEPEWNPAQLVSQSLPMSLLLGKVQY